MMEYGNVQVVAEVGCSHAGSVSRAEELIKLAALAGADYIKFQKRHPPSSVPLKLQNQPHPNERFAYGSTYLEHRMALELDIAEHKRLKAFCESVDIGYSCSVWDVISAREIIGLQPDYIKVPSACNMDTELLSVLSEEYDGDIHISTGMIVFGEKVDLYHLLSELEIANRTVIYHCTSEYPCPFEHLYLLEIPSMKEHLPVKSVGFSNHGYGIAADIVAYTLGVGWIERHFIDDRTFRHTDAAASLEPDGLRRLCRDLKAVRKALALKGSNITEEELEQRKKLRTDD